MATDASILPDNLLGPSADQLGSDMDLYRLSVPQYEAMARAGILTPEDNVELLDGLLVAKMTKNPPHDTVIFQLERALTRTLPDDFHARTQSSVRLKRSVPEPDVFVVRGTIEDYTERHPEPNDVVILIEVSDTTYARDQRKLRLYAEAGIPTSWIVHLPADQVEEHSEPTGRSRKPLYRQRRVFSRGDVLTVALPDHEPIRLAVDEILPRVRT
jgi:hypothetical protein